MMNRPHVLNALSSELFSTLKDAFEELKRDSGIEVVILGGVGRAFCVGLDFKELAAMNGPFSEARLSQATFECFPTIESFDKPIIGAVNGAAITGGFEIALNCDMILATESAEFADTHVRVGIFPTPHHFNLFLYFFSILNQILKHRRECRHVNWHFPLFHFVTFCYPTDGPNYQLT